MAQPQYLDLAEHIGAIISLLGLFAGIAGLLFWRMLVRMEKKGDDTGIRLESKIDVISAWILNSITKCSDCRQELERQFVSQKTFDDWKKEHLDNLAEWKKGRDGPEGIWVVINKIRAKVGI